MCVHTPVLSEMYIEGVWTIVGKSESEIFCSVGEIFDTGSEIFCSECEKKILAILVCIYGDILVLLGDISIGYLCLYHAILLIDYANNAVQSTQYDVANLRIH